ncbi:unnamed protein product [Linum trigynum]|uniref:Uncharacterized protein n=1 Tax=Linum trigynum TaxID=586398 RepID=A0AAV2FVX6_9ROSI
MVALRARVSREHGTSRPRTCLTRMGYMLTALPRPGIPRWIKCAPTCPLVLTKQGWKEGELVGTVGSESNEANPPGTIDLGPGTCSNEQLGSNHVDAKSPDSRILGQNTKDNAAEKGESVVEIGVDSSKIINCVRFLESWGRCRSHENDSQMPESISPNFELRPPDSGFTPPDSGKFKFYGGGKIATSVRGRSRGFQGGQWSKTDTGRQNNTAKCSTTVECHETSSC